MANLVKDWPTTVHQLILELRTDLSGSQSTEDHRDIKWFG